MVIVVRAVLRRSTTRDLQGDMLRFGDLTLDVTRQLVVRDQTRIDFTATEELYSTDDFRRRYTLQGAVRSFNQELLSQNVVDEQTIYYCPEGSTARWYYLDCRTYRTGRVTPDFFAAELERLL